MTGSPATTETFNKNNPRHREGFINFPRLVWGPLPVYLHHYLHCFKDSVHGYPQHDAGALPRFGRTLVRAPPQKTHDLRWSCDLSAGRR
jgi:hypothetical protein